jgi:hypothetical protein
MTESRYAWALVALSVLAGSGVGAALGEVHRNATTPAPPAQSALHTYEMRSVRTFPRTHTVPHAPVTLERVAVTGHGGAAVIEWHTGSWSTLTRNGTAAVAVEIDGRDVVETVASFLGGAYSARAGIARWVGPLSAGPHVVTVRLVRASGPVALPLVVGGAPVAEGVDVTEHAGG